MGKCTSRHLFPYDGLEKIKADCFWVKTKKRLPDFFSSNSSQFYEIVVYNAQKSSLFVVCTFATNRVLFC